MMKRLRKVFSQISLVRIFVLLAICLLLLNSIKIPPHSVPIVHVPNLDATATTTPFYVILVKDENPHPFVLAHEKCHVKQMNHYGPIWTLALNAYYLGKYGYGDNPFEEQANRLSGFCKTKWRNQ